MNRWVYVAVVIIIAICGGFVAELGSPLGRIVFALILPLITFPMGAIGALSALVLIYSGLATVSEANLIAGPIYAIAGMMQWYLVFPKIFGTTLEAQKPGVANKR